MVIDTEENKKKIEKFKKELNENNNNDNKDTITISKQLFSQLQQSNIFIVANAINSIDKYDAILQNLHELNSHIIAMSQQINQLSILIGKEKDIQKSLYRNHGQQQPLPPATFQIHSNSLHHTQPPTNFFPTTIPLST